MTLVAKVNVEALVMAAIILSITLGITYWASKRASSAVGFYAAGRQITGRQNGLAISGDYLSAASFLGIAGPIEYRNPSKPYRKIRPAMPRNDAALR